MTPNDTFRALSKPSFYEMKMLIISICVDPTIDMAETDKLIEEAIVSRHWTREEIINDLIKHLGTEQ